MSPLDPVFWQHHNMIERCWVERNFVHNQPNTNDHAWLDREFTEFCDENGNPVRVTVAETLLFPVFSYRYDDVGPGGPATPTATRDTRAIQDRNARIAKAGASVRLDVRRKFAAPQPVAVAIDRPASAQVAVDPQAVKANRDAAGRTFLVLTGASMDHTEDFSVRAFVNKPDASVDTPPSDPHFVGAFAFFNHAGMEHDHGTGTGDFTLDASETLRRLGIEGGTIELTLVVVPFADRQPRTRELTIKVAELRLIQDVVDRAP